MMNTLVASILFGLACCGWGLLQRFIARIDPESKGRPPLGGGCFSAKLRRIEQQQRGR